jgi:TonB family protein
MKRVGFFCLLLLGSGAVNAAKSQAMRDMSTSQPQTTASGSWNYVLRRSSQAWVCTDTRGSGMCVEHVVAVSNQSNETLECKLRVNLVREDGSVASTFEGPMLVLPRTSPEVHAAISDDKTHAEIIALDCRARASYQRVAKTAGCHYDMMGKPFETYYPAEAKQKSLHGPVIVAFLLDQRRGTAKEVTVAESSQVPMLDAAALRFIRDQELRTNCAGTRFDVLMRFKLRDEIAAQAP